MKPKKCTLFAKEVRYLGHVVSQNGVSTDPDKISAVKNWPVPVSVKEVRLFLGLCGYYRRYIQGFAAIAKCLHRLTENGRAFIWNQECQIAFETLKSKLVEAPILAHPDFTKPFILDTDASLESIGGVLSQEIDGRERGIAYGSRVLSKAERRYCVTRRELLAIVFFVSKFRHYLYGRTFKISTDHGSLRWLLRFKNPEGQLARWLEVLSTYDMEIGTGQGSSINTPMPSAEFHAGNAATTLSGKKQKRQIESQMHHKVIRRKVTKSLSHYRSYKQMTAIFSLWLNGSKQGRNQISAKSGAWILT